MPARTIEPDERKDYREPRASSPSASSEVHDGGDLDTAGAPSQFS
jgi:hypothetical protein